MDADSETGSCRNQEGKVRRLTSRVHGSGMEAEQLHLVFLAFAFPRLGDGVLHVGTRTGRDAREILRYRGSIFRLLFGDSSRLAHPVREHLDVR